MLSLPQSLGARAVVQLGWGTGTSLPSPSLSSKEVCDLLHRLDACESMGPDGIRPRVLKELAEELTRPPSYHFSAVLAHW